MKKPISCRKMEAADWPHVAEIYEQGIATGHATFQKNAPNWEEWDDAHLKNCRILAEIDEKIVGWAALTPVSGRCVYAGVAETSIYISTEHRGQKIGLQLLEKIIAESETEGLWTLQAGIFPENLASVKIHEAAGFRIVGFREKIGKMDGAWRDTLLLERRSKLFTT